MSKAAFIDAGYSAGLERGINNKGEPLMCSQDDVRKPAAYLHEFELFKTWHAGLRKVVACDLFGCSKRFSFKTI